MRPKSTRIQIMSFINENTKEINCKIVYYGPPRCGKSTSLKKIFEQIKQKSKGELISLSTDNNHTLYFDFVPLKLGNIGDYHVRLHLYTVPGEVAYDANRKIISKGVDGVVFVADSQLEKTEANVASLKELKNILEGEGVNWKAVPTVIQYNKRDLPNAVPTTELRGLLNPQKVPDFETIATEGKGVYDVLKAIGTKVLIDLKEE